MKTLLLLTLLTLTSCNYNGMIDDALRMQDSLHQINVRRFDYYDSIIERQMEYQHERELQYLEQIIKLNIGIKKLNKSLSDCNKELNKMPSIKIIEADSL